jgi:hypothetical protein
VKLPEWQDFVGFIVSSLGETAKQANRDAWAGQTFDLRVGIEGMWFQCSRGGAFHDVHTHGNCSWSGVYIVQIDEPERRVTHPVYGSANGVTRLYGPPLTTLGGAFIDAGNAYLLPPHHDIEPGARATAAVSVLARCIRPCPTTASRSGSSSRSTPASTRSQGDQMHGYSAH